jgi:hypothetical protein
MTQEIFGGSIKKHQTPKDPGAVFLEDGYLTGKKKGKEERSTVRAGNCNFDSLIVSKPRWLDSQIPGQGKTCAHSYCACCMPLSESILNQGVTINSASLLGIP